MSKLIKMNVNGTSLQCMPFLALLNWICWTKMQNPVVAFACSFYSVLCTCYLYEADNDINLNSTVCWWHWSIVVLEWASVKIKVVMCRVGGFARLEWTVSLPEARQSEWFNILYSVLQRTAARQHGNVLLMLWLRV